MKKITSFFLVLILLTGLAYGQDYQEINYSSEKARVLEVSDPVDIGDEYTVLFSQEVKLEILTGKYKGQVFETLNDHTDNPAYNIYINKGDKIVVEMEEDLGMDQVRVHISDYSRGDQVFILLGVFLVLIVLIGGKKGIRSILSLGITLAGVFYILIPGLLKGQSPILLSIVISIIVTILTIFIVAGVNNKSIASILGTIGGVVIAGLISYLVGIKANLTGVSAEEATMLLYIPQGISFNFQHLLFAGIILGALGAVMDVGMSIGSSIEEVYRANPSMTKKELFKSGMNVGKDIMGTMVNTLILAYTGTSIPLLLLFTAYETSLTKIINLDIIATEIVRSISGSIGLILTIPITALIASSLIKASEPREE